MSFVYAEKNKGVIKVCCDTQMDLEKCTKQNISKEQRELIDKFGIVKTTIICPTISISFAGNNIFLASNLFKKLYEKKTFEIEEVIELAYGIHIGAKEDDIEFLIATYENNEAGEIISIKEREIARNVSSAWIGTKDAFSKFQECRIKAFKDSVYENTQWAFREVVQGGDVSGVGKIMVTVEYNVNAKSFIYSENITIQTSKDQEVKRNEPIKFHFDASEGGFTISQIPISIEELIVKIYQMESCILYTRNKRCNLEDRDNEQLFSLMLPMLICEEWHGGWKRCG